MRMKNEAKEKLKIGRYSGAWNYLSTKRQAVKSYALSREGPKSWLKASCWPVLKGNVIYCAVHNISNIMRHSSHGYL